jgi:pimeloyl-ACP methyl ester carboxylesterase
MTTFFTKENLCKCRPVLLRMDRLHQGIKFRAAATIALVLSFSPLGAAAQERLAVNGFHPAPDCSALTGYNSNTIFAGYADAAGICRPFRNTYLVLPKGEKKNWYIENFTDAAIRKRWETCKTNINCSEPALKAAKSFTKDTARITGTGDSFGKIDSYGDVDLTRIRRPKYFGKEPYGEKIAAAESSTYTIEFTVPRNNYEKKKLGLTDDIHLRGWYLKGSGVPRDDGSISRALVIMNNGGDSEITATDLPGPEGAYYNVENGKWDTTPFRFHQSEQPGQAIVRLYAYALFVAGFDVLITDRRGIGLSGGNNAYDTSEEARDMFRQLDAIETGKGLRLLMPGGETVTTTHAAAALFDEGDAAQLPVVLWGYSRGALSTGWAMHKNFVEDCDTNLAEPTCGPTIGDTRIKGAILLGPNSGGLGYRAPGQDMEEAAARLEYGITYRLDGDILKGIPQWPALSIVRGAWDYVESLEGSLAAYELARQPKEIYVYNGPHTTLTLSPEMTSAIAERFVAFSRAAVSNARAVDGAHAPTDLKDLVVSAPYQWELTTTPMPAQSK